MASELIFYGRKFLPSGEASRVSGYSTDYIGQLCRGEKLVCRRVGRSWFVEEMSLLAYTALDLNHAPSKVFRLNGNRASTEVRAEAPTSVVVPAAELVSAGVFAQSLVAEAPAGGESSPAMAPVKELVELIPTANTLSQAEEVAPAAPVAEKIPTHSPVSPSVEIIADRVLENLADGWGFLRHQFSPELGQKALVLGLSVALVFGPYFVRNQPVLQTVGELVRASSQNIAAQIGGASEALQSLASASPEELRQAFSLTAVSLVSRSQNLGEMLFESGARAAGEAREGVKEDARLLARAAAETMETGISNASGLLALISEGAAESVRAFAVLVADRYESFSLQAAGLLLMTKESLLSFNNPIDDLARGVYRGVNKGIFSLRDPIRRFLGIKDGSGGTTATTGVSTSTSITKFVYTSPSTKAEPPYRYIPPAPVIESVIERQIVISPANIEQKLFDLQTRLATDIASLRSRTAEVQSATQSNATYINNVYNTVAQTNNLDRVEDLTLLNPKISFGTMTSTALSAVSGTFTALSGNSLTVDSLNGTTGALTGNLTVGGNATIAGNLDVYGTVTPATISATSSVSAPYFTATSTTATSSFAGGLTVQTDKFVVESGSGNVGLGTTSPQARLALSGYADSANPLLLISTSTPSATSTALIITSSGNFGLSTSSPTSRFAIEASTPTAAFLLNQTGTGNLLTLEDSGTAVFSVVDGGNVGVGTTSPFAKLSVSGAGYFDGSITTASSLTAGGDITATNITATGTATFTNLALTGSTTLQHFTFVNATGTSATTTNLFSTNAVFTGATSTSFFTSVFNAISSIFSSITGGSATLGSLTATSSATLSYAGTNMLITTDTAGKLISSSTPVAAYYLATSSIASIFPYASTTALTVSGTGYFGTASTTNLTVSSLTSSRLPFITTAGAFTDDSDLVFTNGNLLTATYASSTSLSTSQSAWLATSGGNVGIGETAPGSKLSVSGGATIGASYDTTAAPTNGMIIPQGALHVSRSSSGDADMYFDNPDQTAGNRVRLVFRTLDSGSTAINIGGLRTVINSRGAVTADNDLILSTRDGDWMTIKNSGNVGIGETAPGSKLSVSGGATIGASYDTTAAPTNGMIIPYAKLSVEHLATTGTVIGTDALTGFTGNLLDLKVASSSKFTVNYLGNITSGGTLAPAGVGANMLITSDASGVLVSSSTPTAAYYLATSSIASVFPYASTTALTVSGTGYFGTASTTNLTVSSLTATRVPFITTAGAFTDDSDLVFTNGNLLTATYASSTSLSTSQGAWLATSGGNVGIGTTVPTQKLHVSGNTFIVGQLGVGTDIQSYSAVAIRGSVTSSSAINYGVNINTSNIAAANSDTIYGLNTDNNLTLASYTGTTYRGININSPSIISGTLASSYGIYVAAQIRGGTNNYGLYVEAPSGGSGVNAAAYFGGNVGIGLTGPATKLHVVGTTPSLTGGQGLMTLEDDTALAANVGGSIGFRGIYTGSSAAGLGLIHVGKSNSTDGNLDSYMSLYTRKNGVEITERVRIDADGNVGIGTTTPAAKLSVEQGGTATLGFYLSGYANATANLFRISTSTLTATSTAFVIDSKGRVGIGLTAPTAQLEVVGIA
ncbi:MAG: hypothetical protein UY62_C0017G0033, partial [Parcubacteria group bacterium GW2011_GWF2_50_9]